MIRSALRFIGKLTLFLGVFLLVFALGYSAWVARRSAQYYLHIKESGRGWETPVNRPDPQLGYAPIPGSESLDLFARGYKVPVRHDLAGFRVPLSVPVDRAYARPLVLALGCSFTFGTGCTAEDTYPYLVAQRLHATDINAAVTGYGLAQMILQARELIPKYQPEYALIQYAPWLVTRALHPMAVAVPVLRVPCPYFSNERSPGRYYVVPPAFLSNTFQIPTAPYLEGPARIRDFASFLLHVGFPTFAYSDAHMANYEIMKYGGLIPSPAYDPDDVVKAIYTEIAALCQKANTKPIIVMLNQGGFAPEDFPAEQVKALHEIENATLVNAHAALYAHLPNSTPEEFDKAYAIWFGDPPILLDRHPNPAAHKIIAETVLQSIHPK